MLFTKTKLEGVFLVELEKHTDDRGFFARTWCQQEFNSQNLNTNLAQCSISFNTKKGTLRGMHYQAEPFPETKVVRCTMGSIYDVVLDLRKDSPTYTQWLSIELTQENRLMLYIPPGFAHGFQTLSNDAEVFYQISNFYKPEFSRGVRWNDPAFGIRWISPPSVISRQDNEYPDFIK